MTDSFISWNMTDSQNTAATSQNTQGLCTDAEIDKLKKYRNYWWKTGNYHPKAKWEEASVKSTNLGILSSGSMSTKSRGSGKEADASYIPVVKPQVNNGGSDGSNQPWPNLVVEVAYSETEANIKNKVENYWLATGRAHDAIVIKLKPIDSATAPSCMTAWHYCTNVRTAAGALNPTMYEFGTVDRQGNLINPQLGQNVIYIQLNCLYHEVPANFVIPPLPNPIPIDLFHARFAIEHCIV
ncbi:1576_t:CDS:2 [Funneliformis geosporum]|uniref:67_t:CDS:1 n=1 Tax=Funneliformis geosporum TaxID=1117311 RepID=A0A9W4SLR9_9GLOM|nr:1576_t:CDS:2 [Funneliformis geosporum]CAI2173262.1 67_t:CDS:2 [Funneliformis geosporum]